MRDLAILFFHLVSTCVRLVQPGGARSIVAESLLLKHQLLILSRTRRRSPRLLPADRLVAALCAAVIRPARLMRCAVVLIPSTIMTFHRLLVRRKYQWLFTSKRGGRPGPKGPSPDPLFEFHRWKTNLRVLEIAAIKSVPLTPMSHPFIERLIGTVRRELLNHVPFWSAADLERKLGQFRDHYNEARVHHSLGGVTPSTHVSTDIRPLANLSGYQWQPHCRGLYELPVAA